MKTGQKFHKTNPWAFSQQVDPEVLPSIIFVPFQLKKFSEKGRPDPSGDSEALLSILFVFNDNLNSCLNDLVRFQRKLLGNF